MTHYKYLRLLFCLFFLYQNLIPANSRALTIERQNIAQCLTSGPNDASIKLFDKTIRAHPEFITTSTNYAVIYKDHQTLAQWCVNSQNLEFLRILYLYGETADQQIANVTVPQYQVCKGSTAFFLLCSLLYKATPEIVELWLVLIDRFAERSPSVVFISRSDGTTPAMILAKSSSPVKHRALQYLIHHSPDAIDPNGDDSVAQCLIQATPSYASMHTLHTILQHHRHYNPAHFLRKVESLNGFATDNKRSAYLPVIRAYLLPAPQRPLILCQAEQKHENNARRHYQ